MGVLITWEKEKYTNNYNKQSYLLSAKNGMITKHYETQWKWWLTLPWDFAKAIGRVAFESDTE